MAGGSERAETGADYVNEVQVVKRFVKRGDAETAARRSADVEAIGREQQRRAVAYSRSRGQL